MDFKLVSDFSPTGDQPEAISQLTEGISSNIKHQTLLGVTGSGKTFTIANVIKNIEKPTLVISHNKTLAAQLYGEFKQFFPENAVEYFVSYYDYYQPEAYLPSSDTYIEKELQINDEIEKLRLSATSALLSGRKDVIVVSSVSCIYGIGNPEEFLSSTIKIKTNQEINISNFINLLVNSLYSRSMNDFKRSNFRVMGDTVDVFIAYADYALRIIFWDDVIESISSFNVDTGEIIEKIESINIYPANLFVTSRNQMTDIIQKIEEDLTVEVEEFIKNENYLEAKRLEERVKYDLEMIKELGYCSGIENYSRYFDKRLPGTRPFCLIDCFPDDFLIVIDESHVTIPQIRGMYAGDKARKTNLVDYGFRLQAALDNRPLQFDEFNSIINQVIYVSATPSEYELNKSEGVIVDQLIRPTGLLDPIIEVRPTLNQIDNLLEEISQRSAKHERILVTTLTKRMAEELSKYFQKIHIKCKYIHSEVDTLERVEIIRELRLGIFDVLIGVNLLREGLDLPEVSLVAILDADKEGFLRSSTALTQTAGRAARNLNSLVIMYGDKITKSMQKTIDETNRRREKQIIYNTENNITPTQIIKSQKSVFDQTSVANSLNKINKPYNAFNIEPSEAAEPSFIYRNKTDLKNKIKKLQKGLKLPNA